MDHKSSTCSGSGVVLTPRAQAHGQTWQEEPFLGSLQKAEGWGFHVFMAMEPLTSVP